MSVVELAKSSSKWRRFCLRPRPCPSRCPLFLLLFQGCCPQASGAAGPLPPFFFPIRGVSPSLPLLFSWFTCLSPSSISVSLSIFATTTFLNSSLLRPSSLLTISIHKFLVASSQCKRLFPESLYPQRIFSLGYKNFAARVLARIFKADPNFEFHQSTKKVLCNSSWFIASKQQNHNIDLIKTS